jgi:hypothetical protein
MNPEIVAQISALVYENTVDSLSKAIGLINDNIDSLPANEQESWIDTQSGLLTEIWELVGFELTDEDFAALGLVTVDPNKYPHEETENHE